jgi:hypothetical protein
MSPAETCTMCHGPFHPALGHWVSETRHWCGACTRDMVEFLKSMLHRRWGGLRFYDHAVVPPPAEPDRIFSFDLWMPTDRPGHYLSQWVESQGLTFEEARIRLQARFPTVSVPPEHLRGLWYEGVRYCPSCGQKAFPRLISELCLACDPVPALLAIEP